MFILITQIILMIFPVLILVSLFHFLLTGNTPSINTPTSSIKYLSEIIPLDKDSVFYDLGCGNSKLLRSLSKKFKNTRFIGIDNSLISYIFSKIAVLLGNYKNIEIKYENFLTSDLSSATHIYLWIYVKDINLLLEKLKKELKKSVLIYSLDFPFEKLSPIEIINLGKEKKFGHTLYVYRLTL
ncbi:MAG TPA: class I SAM-dependent methyltransferase [bacterium]|nr:class I SAM-dependent methyltransferase [bacterium]